MIWIFKPCLKRSGYGMSNKEFVVLTWGGLRGALGLTLALLVGVDERLDFRLRELTLFYMAGLATLTLLINGTTCK
jgi:NhaP-type Na+/H+ or K+/H+ antiporter